MTTNKIKGDWKRLPVYGGLFAIIDSFLFDELSKYKWQKLKSKEGCFYVKRNLGSGKNELLHRRIVGAKRGDIVDHINGNVLDNRLENLRIVSPQQSMMNRRIKGYHFHKGYGKWEVKIGLNYKTVARKYCDTEEEAKKCRKLLENKFFGKYARSSPDLKAFLNKKQ